MICGWRKTVNFIRFKLKLTVFMNFKRVLWFEIFICLPIFRDASSLLLQGMKYWQANKHLIPKYSFKIYKDTFQRLINSKINQTYCNHHNFRMHSLAECIFGWPSTAVIYRSIAWVSICGLVAARKRFPITFVSNLNILKWMRKLPFAEYSLDFHHFCFQNKPLDNPLHELLDKHVRQLDVALANRELRQKICQFHRDVLIWQHNRYCPTQNNQLLVSHLRHRKSMFSHMNHRTEIRKFVTENPV